MAWSWVWTTLGMPSSCGLVLRAVCRRYGRLQYAPTGGWSAPVGVAPAGRSPSVLRLAVARSGTAAFVAYRGFDGTRDLVRAARLDLASGTWSPPDDVSTSTQQVIALDIAADEQDRAIAIWNLLDGTVQTARYNGTWSSPTDRASGALTRDVTVDTDANGNAVAAWTRTDGSRYIVQASVYALATAVWTDADDVSEPTGDAVAPRVGLHTDGAAVIVWQSDSDATYVQGSRYALTSAPRLRSAIVSGPSVTLTWTPGTGTAPTGYTLVASLTPGGTPVLQIPVGTQMSTTVTARDGAYYVRVLANVSGVQIPSNEIVVIVGRGAVPTAPGDLVATVNGNIVTMTWTPPVNESIAPVRTYYVAAGRVPGTSNLAFFPTGNTQTTYVTGRRCRTAATGSASCAERAGALGPASADDPRHRRSAASGAPTVSGGATGPGTVLLHGPRRQRQGRRSRATSCGPGRRRGRAMSRCLGLPASPLSLRARPEFRRAPTTSASSR